MNFLPFRHILLAILNVVSFASTSQVFSIEELIDEKNLDRRIEMWSESKAFIVRNNLDSLKIMGLELMETKNEILIGYGRSTLGSYYIRTNNIPRGISLLKLACEDFRDDGRDIFVSQTENEIGNAYYFMGNYNQAAEHYKASLVFGESTSDPSSSYNGMHGFGRSLCASGDSIRGKLFVQKFLEYCLRDNKFGSAADACGYLGMIAGVEGKIELMSAYYSRAARYALKTGTKIDRANAYTNRAISAYYKGNVNLTIQYFEFARKLREEIGETRPIAESLYNLGVLYSETAELEKAKYYAETGEKLSSDSGLKEMQLECLILLLEIEGKRNNSQVLDKIQRDINRLQNELSSMKNIEVGIVDSVIAITGINKEETTKSNLLHIVAFFLVVGSAGLLLYQERFNSI